MREPSHSCMRRWASTTIFDCSVVAILVSFLIILIASAYPSEDVEPHPESRPSTFSLNTASSTSSSINISATPSLAPLPTTTTQSAPPLSASPTSTVPKKAWVIFYNEPGFQGQRCGIQVPWDDCIPCDNMWQVCVTLSKNPIDESRSQGWPPASILLKSSAICDIFDTPECVYTGDRSGGRLQVNLNSPAENITRDLVKGPKAMRCFDLQ